MAYPYWTNDDSLRKKLIDNRIYVATYWPNVVEWCGIGGSEYELAKDLLPLPIDQRYDKNELNKIFKINNC